MTDSEYLGLAEAALAAVEHAADVSSADIDVERNGNVLTLEFEDGSKIIVNLQVPKHEIWVAAQAGGFHFSYHDGQWCDTRGQHELFAALSGFASLQAGQPVKI